MTPKPIKDEPPCLTTADLEKALSKLTVRFESLENKLEAINDKLESATLNKNAEKLKPVAIMTQPSDQFGEPVEHSVALSDPEVGFLNDDAIQMYRKGMIYFLGKKYSEAILLFSGFIEKHADHPLSGSAQYFIGRSYLNQKQTKLAVKEFAQVLKNYDRSPHISEALRDMAWADDELQRSEESENYKKTLTTLFPLSPAAVNLAKLPTPTDSQKLVSRPKKVESSSSVLEAKVTSNVNSISEQAVSDSKKIQSEPTTPLARDPEEIYKNNNEGFQVDPAPEPTSGAIENRPESRIITPLTAPILNSDDEKALIQ